MHGCEGIKQLFADGAITPSVVMWFVTAAGWYSAPDKMFILVMLIQNAVPTGKVSSLSVLCFNCLSVTAKVLQPCRHMP